MSILSGCTSGGSPAGNKEPVVNSGMTGYAGSAPKEQRSTGNTPHTQEYLNFTEKDIKDQIQAGKDLITDIKKAISNGESQYTIKAGYYRFLQNTLTLSDVSNFTITAEEGTFFIGGSQINLLRLENCTNVTVKGISFDYDELSFFQGTIVEYDRETSNVVVTIDDGYKEFFNKLMSNYNGAIHRIMYYDKDANENQIALSAHANAAFCGAEECGTTEDGETKYKLLMTSYDLHERYKPNIEVGDKVVVPVTGGASAMSIDSCGGCTFENINIYSSSAFCVGDNFGEGGNIYRNVYIGRMPGTDRLIAGSSDGMHFISQKKGPILENCEVSYVCDDSFNCHTFIGMTVEQLSSNEFIILFPMISFVEEGSMLSFFKYQNYDMLGDATVTSATRIVSGKYYSKIKTMRDEFIKATGYSDIRGFDQPVMYRITLDRDITLDNFTAISNYGYACDGTQIKNSKFHDVNGNGIVTRGYNATIDNCYVARVCTGVTISAGGNWTEGPLPRNITVKNCLFEETNQSFEGMSSPGAITIALGSYGSEPRGDSLVQNVTIENNTFKNVNGGAVYANNTSDIVVKNNKVYGAMSITNPSYAILKEHYLFYFNECKNITLENYEVDDNCGDLVTGIVYGLEK